MEGSNCQLVNRMLTLKLVDLQTRGYEYDYYSADSETVQCLQTGATFRMADILIYIDDIDYDHLKLCYKYVHLIDPGNGDKGVLFANVLYIQKNIQSYQNRQECNEIPAG